MLSRLMNKVNRLRDIVTTYRHIESCIHNDSIDVTRLLRLLNLDIKTNIELKRGGGVFLLIYQNGHSEPDYTIKLRSSHE